MYTLKWFIPPQINGSVAEATEMKKIFTEVSTDFFNNYHQKCNNNFEKLSDEDVEEIEMQLKTSISRMTGAEAKSNDVDFLSKMLHLIPARRWTAEELLEHCWLKE